MAATLQSHAHHADAHQRNRLVGQEAAAGLRHCFNVVSAGVDVASGFSRTTDRRRAAQFQEIASIQVAHVYLGGASIIVETACPGRNGVASPFTQARNWSP